MRSSRDMSSESAAIFLVLRRRRRKAELLSLPCLGWVRTGEDDTTWAGLFFLFVLGFILLFFSSSSLYTSIHRIVQSKAKPARKQPANPSYREIRIKEEDERDSFELEIEMKPRPFKEEFTLEERAKESAAMIASYPDRIPATFVSRDSVVCVCQQHFAPDCSVFWVPLDPLLKLQTYNFVVAAAQLMGSVYESYKDEGDGFLYLCYSSEKTFG
uniref:Autophagy-related protein n=1 Tax=Oryza rufipogon TaxID=4529 RepID=A0A0E0NFW1_ORYRU